MQLSVSWYGQTKFNLQVSRCSPLPSSISDCKEWQDIHVRSQPQLDRLIIQDPVKDALEDLSNNISNIGPDDIKPFNDDCTHLSRSRDNRSLYECILDELHDLEASRKMGKRL